jgi:O-antigen ligase
MVRLMQKFPVFSFRLSVARMEGAVWYVFLATVAWQTRIILWQADSVFWEWRSASFWLSDGLMLALLGIALARGWRPRLAGFDWLLAFVFAAGILSLGNADHLGIGLYQLGRFVQYGLFYLYIRQWAFRQFNGDLSVAAFVAGALAQAALGIGQYILQHDIGLRWLGETLLRTDMRGVAVFYDMAHEKILRAYGTLPHPNVLAAYLMLALWGLTWLWIRHGLPNKQQKANDNFRRLSFVIWSLPATVLLWGMYLTFSRTMILAWVVASAAMLLAVFVSRISTGWPNIVHIRRRMVPAIIVAAVVSVLFLAVHWDTVRARMTVGAGDESVRLRVRYAQDAVASGGGWGINVNWIGVGVGNFTSWLMHYDPTMPRFMYQPAHNIYLLAYAETGLLGAGLWLAWLGMLARHAWRAHAQQPVLRVGVMAMLGALFFIGLFDHFFWTLQQGKLLWWLSLAVAAGKEA